MTGNDDLIRRCFADELAKFALDRLRRTDPGEVLQIQQRVAGLFQQNLADGLAVTGFERSPDFGTYLFSSWPSD